MPTANLTLGILVETVYRLSGYRVDVVCGPLERCRGLPRPDGRELVDRDASDRMPLLRCLVWYANWVLWCGRSSEGMLESVCGAFWSERVALSAGREERMLSSVSSIPKWFEMRVGKKRRLGGGWHDVCLLLPLTGR